jgi:hypothetical protein
MGSDGHTCLDVDECTQRNDTNCQQKCVNDDGSFHCECDQPGYKLSVTNGSACINSLAFINDEIYYYIIPIATTVTAVLIFTIIVAVAVVMIKYIMKRKNKVNSTNATF